MENLASRVESQTLSRAEWYVSRAGGGSVGPVSAHLIGRALDAGRVLPSDFTVRAGGAAWVPLAEHLGLLALLTAPPEDLANEPLEPTLVTAREYPREHSRRAVELVRVLSQRRHAAQPDWEPANPLDCNDSPKSEFLTVEESDLLTVQLTSEEATELFARSITR